MLRLQRWLGRNLRSVLKGVQASDERALEAAKTLGGLHSSLLEKGLAKELEAVSGLYGRELARVRDAFEASSGRDFALSDADVHVTEQLIRFDAAALATQIDGGIDELRGMIFRSVVAGEPPDVPALVDRMTDGTAARAQTLVRTSMMGFNRAVTVAKAKDAFGEDPLFLYMGPLDGATRKFCRPLVGKVLPLSLILTMDNGQGLDVLTFCGGYNCRHQWRPVSPELAKQLGYDPEDSAALAAEGL